MRAQTHAKYNVYSSFLKCVSLNTQLFEALFQMMDSEKAFVGHLLSSFNFNIMQIVQVSVFFIPNHPFYHTFVMVRLGQMK